MHIKHRCSLAKETLTSLDLDAVPPSVGLVSWQLLAAFHCCCPPESSGRQVTPTFSRQGPTHCLHACHWSLSHVCLSVFIPVRITFHPYLSSTSYFVHINVRVQYENRVVTLVHRGHVPRPQWEPETLDHTNIFYAFLNLFLNLVTIP